MSQNLKITHRKAEFYYQTINFHVVPYDIPLCCQIFFWGGWQKFRREIKEYGQQKSEYSTGIIKCPDCLIQELQKLSLDNHHS